MKNKQQKELSQWILNERISTISIAYKTLSKEILNMIASGKTTEDIKSTCEWYINNVETAKNNLTK
jgi:hypothetical protein